MEIDIAVINKLLVCPNWIPATHDGKFVDYQISLGFEIRTSKRHPIEIDYPLRSDYIKY